MNRLPWQHYGGQWEKKNRKYAEICVIILLPMSSQRLMGTSTSEFGTENTEVNNEFEDYLEWN